MTQRTVLIVDDNPEDREFLRRALLRDPNHTFVVVEEESSARALARCTTAPPDCVLLDYRMSEMDGLAFLTALKGKNDFTPCAVVVISGAGNGAVAVDFLKQGAQDYLAKGRFTQEGLRRTIHHAIEKVKTQRLLEHQQHALQESEARFRALANAVPAMVWTAAPDGTITYANDQWLRYCGVTLEQNAHDWPALILHSDDYDRCTGQWSQALASGDPYEIEVRNRRHDGEYRWFLTRAAPARDAAGRITGWYGTTMDIHERKRMEDALVRQATELQRINADLEQFAYICAHDLQEPVRMVGLYTQILARRYQGSLDAQADEYIGMAVEGASRMHALLEDLLAYTELETMSRPPTDTNCDELLARELAAPILLQAVEATGAVVTHDSLPTVTADARQLRLVFLHLLENALTFSNTAPPRVHVSARRENAHWLFSVRDNGIGIEPQYAERIFRMFKRLHPHSQYPGTGMGLTICKKVIERHGGRIWVESELGKGATFYFTLGEK